MRVAVRQHHGFGVGHGALFKLRQSRLDTRGINAAEDGAALDVARMHDEADAGVGALVTGE